jgi:hypothetical protein
VSPKNWLARCALSMIPMVGVGAGALMKPSESLEGGD